LFEFKNVLDVTYGAYVVNGAYAGVGASDSNSKQATIRDQAVAIIREFLAGKTAAVRQSARDANAAVSTIQIFTDAIETITEKLMKMLELAKKALGQDYLQLQAEQMQKRFRDLIREINQTVYSTGYKFNKPFSGSGKTISISISSGTKIDVFARDFRLDARNLDIEKDPQDALSRINEAITNINEYKTYLDRQAARIEDITAAIERDIQGAMGVDVQDFQPEPSIPVADYAAGLILQGKQTSINTQANLTPDETLTLLKDNG